MSETDTEQIEPEAEPTLADENPNADYDAEPDVLDDDETYVDPDGFGPADPADVPGDPSQVPEEDATTEAQQVVET